MKQSTNVAKRKRSLSKLKQEAERFNELSVSFCPNRQSILLNQLSEIEIRIIGYFKQGYDPEMIAEELGMSMSDLNTYKNSICKQLGGNKI